MCVHASAVFSPFVDFSDFVNNCITGTRKLVIIVGIKKIQSYGMRPRACAIVVYSRVRKIYHNARKRGLVSRFRVGALCE